LATANDLAKTQSAIADQVQQTQSAIADQVQDLQRKQLQAIRDQEGEHAQLKEQTRILEEQILNEAAGRQQLSSQVTAISDSLAEALSEHRTDHAEIQSACATAVKESDALMSVHAAVSATQDALQQQRTDQENVLEKCRTEREQTQQLLAKVRQILSTDEALREKLQHTLQHDIVTRSDFESETQRLWEAVEPLQKRSDDISADTVLDDTVTPTATASFGLWPAAATIGFSPRTGRSGSPIVRRPPVADPRALMGVPQPMPARANAARAFPTAGDPSAHASSYQCC